MSEMAYKSMIHEVGAADLPKAEGAARSVNYNLYGVEPSRQVSAMSLERRARHHYNHGPPTYTALRLYKMRGHLIVLC